MPKMMEKLDQRSVSLMLIVMTLSIGILGDLAAQDLISDKAAKWAAIAMAFLTNLKSALFAAPDKKLD